MTVLGIDLAAGAPKTYACLLEPSDDQLLQRMVAGCGDEGLRQMAQVCTKVVIDAPFGWPARPVRQRRASPVSASRDEEGA